MTRRPRRSGDLEWTQEMLDTLRGLLNTTRYNWMMTDLEGHKLPLSNSSCWGDLAAHMREAFPGQGFKEGSKGHKQIRDKFRNTLGPGIDTDCSGVWTREQWLPVLQTFPSMFKRHCSGVGKVGSLYQHVFQAIRRIRPDGKSPSTEAIKNRLNKAIDSYRDKSHEQVANFPWYTPEMFETIKALATLQMKVAGPKKRKVATRAVETTAPSKTTSAAPKTTDPKPNYKKIALRVALDTSTIGTATHQHPTQGDSDGDSTPMARLGPGVMALSSSGNLTKNVATEVRHSPATISRSSSGTSAKGVYTPQQTWYEANCQAQQVYHDVHQQTRQCFDNVNVEPLDDFTAYTTYGYDQFVQPLVDTINLAQSVADDVARWSSSPGVSLPDPIEHFHDGCIPMSQEDIDSLDMCEALKTPCKLPDEHSDLLGVLGIGSLPSISCGSLFDWPMTV